ncbi:hypothetical protein [Candidatus Bodocaedibacter vickermanii]|uniref:Uncharacterized protein n=1 Tax=Candidatus Bodocaedibacter vickermanii TaxID=2741701 RepID=A0A7L9RSP7_9PROT|nr:hypothetical protein CPBP_00170 [Candidatus Paracaedibacteraceae bacterium 'Lake Konstanz']
MLNRWINRLVRSEERRHQLLRKPRISWPSLLQTGSGGKLQALCRHPFPERLCIQVELKPTMVLHKEITATVNVDDQQYSPTPIYQQLDKDRKRLYGRCSSIDLVIKAWHAVDHESIGVKLTQPSNKILYTKNYFTCSTSIVDQQTVENHRMANAASKRKHIHPYGGYLGPDAHVGDALYMTLTPNDIETKINIHSYDELLEQRINLFDVNSMYGVQCIDPTERHKILPLMSLIKQGEIPTTVESDHKKKLLLRKQ